jgi:hypothetical protein
MLICDYYWALGCVVGWLEGSADGRNADFSRPLSLSVTSTPKESLNCGDASMCFKTSLAKAERTRFRVSLFLHRNLAAVVGVNAVVGKVVVEVSLLCLVEEDNLTPFLELPVFIPLLWRLRGESPTAA